MNYYSIFYWLTVADSVKQFFDSGSNFFTGFATLFLIGVIIFSIGKAVVAVDNKIQTDEAEKADAGTRQWEKLRKHTTKLFYTFFILAIIFWAGYIFTPTKKDCLLIVAGGAVGNFITTDSSAKALPADVTKFLHLSLNKEIEELGTDAKIELKKAIGTQSPKEAFIEKAKTLTKEQLIQYLQTDTTIAK